MRGLRRVYPMEAVLLCLTFSALLVATTCAAPNGSVSSGRRYEERIKELDRQLWSEVRASWEKSASPPPATQIDELMAEAMRLRTFAELAGSLTEQAREIRPPAQYRAGHALLIKFYLRSQAFLKHAASSINRQIDGEDTLLLNDESTRLFNRLLDSRVQVLRYLPFLAQVK